MRWASYIFIPALTVSVADNHKLAQGRALRHYVLMQAVKRLQETLDWRRDVDVESITCSACLASPRAHYMHPVGFDRLGRPVLYSCLQLAANRSVEDNRHHMIATFEQVSRHHS